MFASSISHKERTTAHLRFRVERAAGGVSQIMRLLLLLMAGLD